MIPQWKNKSIRHGAAAPCNRQANVLISKQTPKEGIMKKRNLNWQSVLLGVVLCAILAVFIASKAADAQTTQQQARVLQRAANMSDVYEKTLNLEARIATMDERLIRIEEKIDHLQKTVHNGFNVIDRTLANKK
jgi:septal ring factor EnvC (AmiA/AmiB activator)